MKKINYLLLGAGALVLASCSNEEFKPSANSDGTALVRINLSTPQLSTRAYSDGTTASQLQYAVYVVNADGSLTLLPDLTVTNGSINLQTQVTFKLLTNRTYGFVFWAANENAPYEVNFTDGGAFMTVDYNSTINANDENLDGFYTFQQLEVKNDQDIEAHLYRPFAQINVGADDLADAKKSGYEPSVSHVNVTNVYQTLNLISGGVDNPQEAVEFDFNTIPQNQKFPVDGHDYLAMIYALVDKDKANVKVEFSAKSASNEEAAKRTITDVPVQRNYRTNIFGQLFTSNVDVNVIIEPDYMDEDKEPNPDYNIGALLMIAQNGGGVVLGADVELTGEDLNITKNATIDLNGNKITLGESATIRVNDGAHLIIKGDGEISKTSTDENKTTACIYVDDNSTLTIEGGTFTSDQLESIYINTGTVYITGGTFIADNAYNGTYFTINCTDANYKNGTAKFVVTGGKFKNFNPAASKADLNNGQEANWVPEGYSVFSVEDGSDTYYYVVPDDIDAVVTTGQELQEALTEGKNVLLTDNTTTTGVAGSYNPSDKAGIVIKNGQVFDGGGNELTVTGANNTWDSNICINNGTVKNVTLKGGFRGLFINMDNKDDIYVENVTVPNASGITYALNINEGNRTKDVYVSNSTFYGWTSWSGAKAVYFTECNFAGASGNGWSGDDEYVNHVMRPYVTTVFKNCTFTPDLLIWLDSIKTPDVTITFDNCTVNGVTLTSSNYKELIVGNSDWKYGTTWDGAEELGDNLIFK